MNSSFAPLTSFAALAVNQSYPAPSASAAIVSSSSTPTDSTKQPYPSFVVSSPMSTASTASGSDSPSALARTTKGVLITSRCSTPERLHSPLSLDNTTAPSSAASSRATSPTYSHLTLASPPSTRDFNAPGLSSHAASSASSSHASVSPAISPMSQPVTPPSPAHSSASSSASSDHSSTPTASSSSSSSSSSYRPDRRSARSKRIPLTASQKALLEEFFRTNHYPTRDEKTELGNKIGLSSDKVHKWSVPALHTHSRTGTSQPCCSLRRSCLNTSLRYSGSLFCC